MKHIKKIDGIGPICHRARGNHYVKDLRIFLPEVTIYRKNKKSTLQNEHYRNTLFFFTLRISICVCDLPSSSFVVCDETRRSATVVSNVNRSRNKVK